MSILTKSFPKIAGALMIVSATFGNETSPSTPKRNSFEQGRKLVKSQMVSGYNAPARIDVRGSWDLFMDVSFIYWQLSQDNMEIAFADKLSNGAYTTNFQIQGDLMRMDFDYKPGFKIGLGLNLDQDDWDLYASYTRIHSNNDASAELNTTATEPDKKILLLLPTFGSPYVIGSNAYNSAHEHWKCNLDSIDLDLRRVYYVGSQLTFHPFFGMRSAFISQNVHVQYVNTSFENLVALGNFQQLPGEMNVYQRNRSWSIGPRAGVNTNWALGQGIRFFGNTNADILYTKYKIQDKSTFLPTVSGNGLTAGTSAFDISKNHAVALRAHLDCELGLGWGSYFDNNNWHVDLAAAYEFQVFFDQNMLTKFYNPLMPKATSRPNGNLYAQGLTTTVRFDF